MIWFLLSILVAGIGGLWWLVRSLKRDAASRRRWSDEPISHEEYSKLTEEERNERIAQYQRQKDG